MELKVYSRELVPLGIIDEVNSLIWSGSYWQEGSYDDVKVLAPRTDNNNELLVKGNILVKHGDDAEYTDSDGNTWRRGCQITYKHITRDEKGVEQIEVQGCTLKKWLSKRVITTQIITTATGQNIINKIVADNMGSNAAAGRQFTQFEILPQDTITGDQIEYSNEAYINCGLEIFNRAVASKLGYDILVCERKQKYGFWLYKGKDLTATNTAGNTPCIFSRDFDNVSEQEYTESIENMKNAIYVQGTAKDDTSTAPLQEVAGSDTGYDRDEVFLSAADISWTATDDTGTEITLTDAQYIELLKTKGATELANYGEIINFVSTINTSSNLQYKKDFHVGDQITCVEKNWGIKIDARIIKVAQTYQSGKTETEVTFGESLPTLMQQIRKAR